MHLKLVPVVGKYCITGCLCKHDIYTIMRVKLKWHKYNSHKLYLWPWYMYLKLVPMVSTCKYRITYNYLYDYASETEIAQI